MSVPPPSSGCSVASAIVTPVTLTTLPVSSVSRLAKVAAIDFLCVIVQGRKRACRLKEEIALINE